MQTSVQRIKRVWAFCCDRMSIVIDVDRVVHMPDGHNRYITHNSKKKTLRTHRLGR